MSAEAADDGGGGAGAQAATRASALSARTVTTIRRVRRLRMRFLSSVDGTSLDRSHDAPNDHAGLPSEPSEATYRDRRSRVRRVHTRGFRPQTRLAAVKSRPTGRETDGREIPSRTS